MDKKIDYKKDDKHLYLPGKKPVYIEIPAMKFIMINGSGAPADACYQNAVSALYTLSYTIKMSKMGNRKPDNYEEFVVYPLEGLWWQEEDNFTLEDKSKFKWTAMIRQPDFVTNEFFVWALEEAKKKKAEIDFSDVRFEMFEEGPCVQAMHIGPYDSEPETIEKMNLFMEENRLASDVGTQRRHHELYLSDPNRTAPEKLRTVLRLPVKPF